MRRWQACVGLSTLPQPCFKGPTGLPAQMPAAALAAAAAAEHHGSPLLRMLRTAFHLLRWAL